ncbi:hypothetical protein CROQUDRAFT_688208, partial [Cronartium quercuum f. sp. fusiforme G11]
WPTHVSCERNIGLWEEGLKNDRKIAESRDVISGFKEGFDQGIKQCTVKDLKWYTLPNHSFTDLAREKIEMTSDRELLAGKLCLLQ